VRGAIEVGERDGGFRCEPIQQEVKAWKGAGAWYEAMRLFPRGRRRKRGAVASISSRPTLLSLIVQSKYLRRFGGG
jgi:hypothetical protein